MSELKRCPFCDEMMIPSSKFQDHPNGYLKWLRFHPDNKCFLSAFSIDLRETEKVKEWNTRKPMERIVECLEDTKTKCFVTGITANPYEFGACHAMDKAIKIVKEEM